MNEYFLTDEMMESSVDLDLARYVAEVNKSEFVSPFGRGRRSAAGEGTRRVTFNRE
jgi:hypothetical protein